MAVAAAMTVSLFYLMQTLIQNAGSAFTEDTTLSLVEFVRVPKERQLEVIDNHPQKPQPPDEPPPMVQPRLTATTVDSIPVSIGAIEAGKEIGRGSGFAISDGDYLPIVKVQPRYPRRALSRGMTGWVIVEFTVSTIGNVKDVVVVNNCAWVSKAGIVGECDGHPNSVFDSAAIKAATKFKYKPRVIDGNPIGTAGVQNKITFELAEG